MTEPRDIRFRRQTGQAADWRSYARDLEQRIDQLTRIIERWATETDARVTELE